MKNENAVAAKTRTPHQLSQLPVLTGLGRDAHDTDGEFLSFDNRCETCRSIMAQVHNSPNA